MEAVEKDGVLIKPKRIVDPDDTLSPAEAKIVRRGEAQLKRGESKPWRVVKHELFALELSRGALTILDPSLTLRSSRR
jgi:hypothetical protein